MLPAVSCTPPINVAVYAQVVETLTDSLTLPETPMNIKVARLMLASDVLHNSTAHVHNASRYRSLLEASLPDIFESLQARQTLPAPSHPSQSNLRCLLAPSEPICSLTVQSEQGRKLLCR